MSDMLYVLATVLNYLKLTSILIQMWQQQDRVDDGDGSHHWVHHLQ